MWGIRAIAIALTLAAIACANRNPYQCSASSQCVLDGEPGYCEPQGYCSFVDPGCTGGRRFEPNAGNGLGGICTDEAPPADAPVDMPGDIAPACGAVGQTCCASAPSCVDGASCQGGTCAACVTDFSFGHRFACFLKAGGTVWCSGENDQRQLGRTDNTSSAMPIQVSDASGPITDATAISAHNNHACAIRSGGKVSCWGDGTNGQLGNGTTPPSDASELPVTVVKANMMPLTNIVEIAGGFDHTCARDTVGSIWCWGSNRDGQLGDGTIPTAAPFFRNHATQVLVAAGGAPFDGATSLASGGFHLCALKANQAWCWGSNGDGQVGDTTTANRSSPVMITAATSIGLGNYHTCMVKPDTTVRCSGANYHGMIGNGLGGDFSGASEATPTAVLTAIGGAPISGVSKVLGGGSMSCLLTTAGHVSCWGDNKHGQVGTGTSNGIAAEVLRKTATGAEPFFDVDRIAGKFTHACAHRANGEWWCWGRGRDGEFGDNTFTSRGIATPLKVGLTCP